MTETLCATFAIPGDLHSPTGGYSYARHILAHADQAGMRLDHLALPGGFPTPCDAELSETARRLGAVPPDRVLLIDGLALGVLPVDLLRALHAPVVALCHHPLGYESGLDPAEAAARITAERAALGCAAHILTTSHATARILSEDFEIAPARISVAPPGTEPATPSPGSDGTKCRILSVGTLTPRKGHDTLIAALADLGALPWCLEIIGSAGRDPVWAKTLERQIQETGLAGRVHLCGTLDDNALSAAYMKADLFVLASRYEGFGMVYTEAMARHLPVIGSKIDAIAEATMGGALLIPPDDVMGLRQALATLIADPRERKRWSERSAQSAAGFTRWSQSAKIIASALRRVMETKA